MLRCPAQHARPLVPSARDVYPSAAGILSSCHCRDPRRGHWEVDGCARLRAAGSRLAGAAAGPVTSVALLIAGCALLGVAAAGGGGAVAAIVLAAVLVAVVFVFCDRMALSAMLARPVSEVEHPGSTGWCGS